MGAGLGGDLKGPRCDDGDGPSLSAETLLSLSHSLRGRKAPTLSIGYGSALDRILSLQAAGLVRLTRVAFLADEVLGHAGDLVAEDSADDREQFPVGQFVVLLAPVQNPTEQV